MGGGKHSRADVHAAGFPSDAGPFHLLNEKSTCQYLLPAWIRPFQAAYIINFRR